MIKYDYLSLLLILLLSVSLHTLAASPSPYELRVELLKGAKVASIADASPELSWLVSSAGQNTQQLAYRVQIVNASMGFAKVNKHSDLVWDSGKVLSDKSIGISVPESILQPNTDYLWRVKTWSSSAQQTTSESHWSQNQLFTTARQFSEITTRHPLEIREVAASSRSTLHSGNTLFDFGKVAFGYIELSLDASEAGTIIVHMAERGDSTGALKTIPEKSSVRYYSIEVSVSKGFGVYRVNSIKDKRNTKEKAIPIPGRFGRIAPFRFVEIEPGKLKLDRLLATQIAINYPFEDYAASFHSNNSILNQVWDLCKYTMKATSFAGVYVDGDRERIPYEADAYINQLSHYAVDSEFSLARYSHEYLMEHPTWPTEWKQHSVKMAWADWMYTGNIESLKRNFEKLRKEKTLEHLARADGLLETFPDQSRRGGKIRDIVDWPAGERDGFEFTKVNAVVNAFYYKNLLQMAQMADAINHKQLATEYYDKANIVFASYNKVFFNSQTGLYVDGEGSTHSGFHANVAALSFGLIPEQNKKEVITFIKAKGMAGSVYFAQYLLEALYENGEAQYALELMSATSKRSWYNMIRAGSTITMEAWDDEFKPNQDWNHAWGAVPGNIISRYLLGIKPIEPGFTKFEVKPQLGNLSHVEGKIPSIAGTIEIEASYDDTKRLSISLTIPANTHAKLVFPNKLAASNKDPKTYRFTINGRELKVENDGNNLHTAFLESGSYHLLMQ